MHNLVLVDKRVTDYAAIVDAVDISNDVHYIVFDIFDLGPDVGGGPGPFAAMQAKISELNIPAFNSIGLVQHNNNAPFYQMFGPACPEAMITDVKTSDASLQTWQSVSDFITWLKTNFGIVNFDLMACALYSDANWKYVIDTLTVQTGVTIRASTDDTGAAGLGGNWFLESHTGVNLKGVYFTEAIENYRGVLFFLGSDNWYIYGSKRRPTKSFAVGGLEVWGNSGAGGTNNTGVSLTNIVGVASNGPAFAALKADGTVVVWGQADQGASYTTTSTDLGVPVGSLTGVVDIVGNNLAFAAIKNNGSVVLWGRIGATGASNNTSVDLTSVVDIYSTSSYYAFAAIRSNGACVCWGDTTMSNQNYPNNNNASSTLTSGVALVYSNGYSFAALKIDGRVLTWGVGGSDSSSVSSDLSSGVVAVYSQTSSHTALKNDGTIVSWGSWNGTTASTTGTSGVLHVFPSSYGLAALKTNGSVQVWGSGAFVSSAPAMTNVVTICSNQYSFAALKSDGTVVAWGNSNYGGSTTTPVNVASDLSGVIALYSNQYSYAALKSDGTVVCWGDSTRGGSTSSPLNAASQLTGVVRISATNISYSALKTNGSVIQWGSNDYNNTTLQSANITSGIVDIFNNENSQAALKPTSTPSYDLSMSYYSDTDRLSILCSRDYRRTANLVTLNSNVHTLSATRSLQKFNYTMPTAKPLTMIVPDYQTAPYSLTSTITLPTSIVGSNSMLITSEIGERVDISGVGTYVNYGTYVYKVETNGTYTKTTSLTINSVSYNLYGGDGVYYSGIALYNPTSTTPTLSNFSVSAKTYGTDTSFNLTDPSSNSPAGFTFSSSNTQVATISGRTVTVVGPGTSVITASQGGSGNFMNADISASLVVGFGNVSSLSSKALSDGPFVIPTPLSNVATTYGTRWAQLGLDISGTQIREQNGISVSLSADGTTLAIGSAYYDKSGGTTNGDTDEGRTRVYKYNGTSWGQLGLDISGTQNSEISGYSVSLSADGTTVAIGSIQYDASGGTANSNTSEGRVRVYKYINKNGTSSWDQLGLDISGTQAYEYSGWSVSLSADGTTVAIGSADYDVTNNEGLTRVYKYNGTTWGQLGLDISGNQANEYSGYSVSLSADGTTVAIGSAGFSLTEKSYIGRTRIYKYNKNGTSWAQLGLDISGTQIGEQSGWSVSLSADGTTVACGSYSYDVAGNEGRTRIYKYNKNGTLSWDPLGSEILGTQASENSGHSVSLSADGTTVAIGSYRYDVTGIENAGRTRIYKYNTGTSLWVQLGLDISGNQVDEYNGHSVSLSADGTIVAIGCQGYDTNGGTYSVGLYTNEGRVRVYKIDTSGNYTYTIGNSAIADICGNIVLPKTIGSTTITVTQAASGVNTSKTATAQLTLLSYAPTFQTYTIASKTIVDAPFDLADPLSNNTGGAFTFTSSNASVATISGRTVTITGAGTTAITATQAASGDYATGSVTASFTVNLLTTVLGALTVPAKAFGDASFNLTDPTSNNTGGAFTFTSSNTSVATISGRTVTIVGLGTSVITASQAAAGNYTAASTTASLVVGFGNLSSITRNISDGGFVIPTPLSNVLTTYGRTWNQLGADIDGEAYGDYSGHNVSLSADGTVVAIGAWGSDGTTGNLSDNRGHVRVYKYTPGKAAVTNQNDLSFGPIDWTRLGADIDGETSSDYSSHSVSLSADGTVVAIGAYGNDGSGNLLSASGHVRVYKYTPSKTVNVSNQNDLSFGPIGWTRLGKDIDGEAASDQSGFSVSLSADGTVVAIGAYGNDGSGNGVNDDRGHVRVYKYNPNKTVDVSNQSLSTFGPAGWDRLGADIDGEALEDRSGWSVSISADGTVVAIGAIYNDGAFNLAGHVRVYKYTPGKIVDVSNQNDLSFGPIGWTRLGKDIDGEAAEDTSGYSVSLSADGTTVAIGARLADITTGINSDHGHVRVYKYNSNKTDAQLSNQSLSTFGPAGWDRLGADINGEFANDQSGFNVSISADGTVVAIGAPWNDGTTGNVNDNRGHVRVYKYTPGKIVDVSNQSDLSFGPIGWTRIGSDIDGWWSGGGAGDFAGNTRVSLSADGNMVAIGSPSEWGVAGNGRVRVYRIDTSGNYTYTIGNSAIADICGNIVLPKTIGGSTTITVTQSASGANTSKTASIPLLLLPITPTFQTYSVASKIIIDASFNLTDPSSNSPGAFTFTSSNASVATISGRTVTITGAGTTTITATQAASGDYLAGSTTASFTVNPLTTVLGTLTVPAKTYGDASFNLTDPTSNNTGGAFTFTSGNTQVATISGRTVTILGPGTSVITATQAASGNYGAASTTASLVVGFGNLSSLSSKVLTDGPFVIPAPLSNVLTTYGTTWGQLGADIIGNQASEVSGYSVSLSADGTTVAIGSLYYDKAGGTTNGDTNEGRTRVYKYNGTSWGQLGLDISGNQVNEQNGSSVSLSADGTVVAIGSVYYDASGGTAEANTNEGRTRVYKYNGTSWAQLGGDISGNQSLENSGWSVSLSADGTIVAIGSVYNSAGYRAGRTRIYKLNENVWGQLGLDISGNQAYENSGWSVSLSADGTTVAIGSYRYNVIGGTQVGRTRVYKYNTGTSLWGQLGLDISGNQASEESGYSVSLSADGTTVAIGSRYYNNIIYDEGRTRIYKYNKNGTFSWDQLGLDISGNQASEESGISVSLSADGTIVAIGSMRYDKSGGTADANTQEGRVRVYKYNGTAWGQLGLDISGNQEQEFSGRVHLSADGTIVAIGSQVYDKAGGNDNEGRVRVYRIDTSGNYTYTSGNSAIADICGNIVLPKTVGSTTITVTQAASGVNTSKTATAQLTLSYAPTYQTYTIATKTIVDAPFDLTDPSSNSPGTFTFTSSNASVATISGRTVTIVSIGTTTITATQAASGDYLAGSTTASFTVNPLTTVLGALTVPAKTYGDASFNLADPTSNNTGGAFTFTSGNTQVATISGRTVTILGPGTSVITATQAASGNYGAASTTASLVVAFGNLSSLSSKLLTDGPFVLPTPLSNVLTTYGTTWNQLGADIDGEGASDRSGQSVSLSADGTVVAIGAYLNDGTGADAGHVRVYKYTPGKAAVTVQTDLSFGPVDWTRLGADIDGEFAGNSSGWSVSLSADGTVVAIGAPYNDGSGNGVSDYRGHVRVYKYTPGKAAVTNQNDASFGPIGWTRLGKDIDGEAASDYSGYSVSLSADGTVVAIGAYYNDGSGNLLSDSGHVRVYKYNPNKMVDVSNQSLSTFGPAGWDRLGADIDGEAVNDWSGWCVSVSANGTVVAIGAQRNNGSSTLAGHVRVYKYNPNKTVAQLSDQSLSTFGPAGWDRLGADIDGEATYNYSGYSVSLSANGTIVAIGSYYNDGSGNLLSDSGHVRVYKYNPNKTVAQLSDQSLSTFGPVGWDRLGADIDGEAAGDQSGISVSLSSDGTIVAIGANGNNGTGAAAGHVRVYRYTPTKTVAVTSQSDLSFGPIGWTRIGADIDGEAATDQSGYSVSLSTDGTTVAIGASTNDGRGADAGQVRVYKIDTSGNYTYTIGNSAIADICGNIVLPKSIGSTTITVTQAASGANTSKSATVPFASLFRPTIQPYSVASKNFEDAPFDLTDPSSNSPGAFTFTSSNASVATISGRTVTIVGGGITTITATQAASGDYITSSTTASFTVNPITSITGTFTVPAKVYGDASFNLTDPSSNRAVAFTYTSSNTQVATISGRTVTIIGPGTSVITASQGPNFIDVSASLVVGFGNLSSLSSKVLTDGPFVIPTPLSNVLTTYGTTWNQLGAHILGTQKWEYSGYSVSLSADGTIIAIGSYGYDKSGGTTNGDTDEGRTRVYKYNGTSWGQLGLDISGNQEGEQNGISVSLSADGTVVAIGSNGYDVTGYNSEGRTRIYKYNNGTNSWAQLGGDISGTQIYEYSGYSVSLSADGTTVAIGSNFYDASGGTANSNTSEGRTRIYKLNGTSWVQLGLDISGNQVNEQSGYSLSLSADGTTVAIGSYKYDASGLLTNANTDEGRVRIYKYNKNGTLSWDQLGLDISGNQVGEQSGWSVSLSADGTTVAIGSNFYDVTWPNNQGRTRIYKYNKNGTLSWDPLGSEILGTQNAEISGHSVSLSADGTIVAIGSVYYTGERGRVRVYKYNNGSLSWGQLGLDISGNQDSENSGYSVSLSADGTTVAIGSYVYDKAGGTTDGGMQEGRVRVYRIDTSGNYTYTSSNSAIADICGNIVLPKSIGSTTITVTQAASGANTSKSATVPLVLNLTTTTITRATDISGTISKTYAPGLTFSVAATSSRGDGGGAVSYTSSDTSVATVDSSSGLVTVLKAGTATLTAAQSVTTQYAAGSASWALTVSLGTNPWSNTFAITSPAVFGDTVTYTAPALSYSPAGAITYSTTTDVSNVATIDSSSGAITLVGYGTVTFRATAAATNQYASSSIDSSAVTVNRASTTITRATDISGTISKTYAPDLSFSVAATSSRGDGGGAVSYTSSDTSVATVDSSSGLVTVLKAGTATLTAAQTQTSQFTAGSASWALTVALGTNPWSNTFAITSPVAFGDTVTYTAPAMSYSPAGAITYSTTTDVSNVAIIDASSGAITLVGYGTVTFRATAAATSQYAESYIETSVIRVNRATTTITRASDAYVDGTISKTYAPDLSFNVAATSSRGIGGGAVSYSSSDTTVATVDSSSGLVTVLKAGSTTITASQSTTTQYSAGSASWELTVALGTNPWSNTFAITTSAVFGDTVTYTAPAATYSQGGAITYSTTTDVSNVATINASTGAITLVGAGTVTFRATAAATSQYAESYIDSSAITISRATTTITRASDAYVSGTISKAYAPDLSFNVAATSSRGIGGIGGGAVSYTSSDTSVATVDSSSGLVTVLKAGPATITASQTQTTQYTAGSASWALTVDLGTNPWSPAFTITSPVVFGDTVTYTAPALSYSPAGAITYSTTTDVSNVAIIDASSGAITLVGAGTVTFRATAAATDKYASSYIDSSAITVNRATTTITRRNDDYVAGVISKTYIRDLSFNVAATSSRPGETAVTYSSSDTSVATVNSSSGVVTVLKAGPATITASQTQTSQYTAGSISWSFVNGLGINPWANTFSITSPVVFGDTVTYTPPVATYSPAGAITYGTTTDVSNVAIIDPNTGVITLVGAGTVTFTATQAETDQYDDSTIHSSVVTVNRAATTITRASDAYVSGTISKTYAPDLSFSIAATSSRPGGGGTAVLYSSSDTAVATVDASGRVTVLSGTATGSPVTLTAYQAENAQYAYGSITWSLSVSLASNTITRGANFTDATITRTYDPTSTTFNVSASSDNSATDIVFTSSDTNVASITRVNATTSQITINTAGSITITATQSASNKYAAALDVSCALVINRRIATLFRSAPYTSSTISKYYESAAFYLAASSVSDGAVTYESSNTNVATIDSTSGEVILYSLGSTTITASQANSSRYTTPINISWALDISRGNTTITGIPTDISKNVTNVPFYLAAASASGGAITYSLADPSSNVATVNASSGLVTLLAPGTFTVVVSQAGTTLYNAPTSVSSTITVSGAGNILENVTVNPAIQNFVNVDLSGASLAGSTLSGVSFNGASLAGASLVGATAVGTSFVNANLTNVNFSGANISGADFTNANISGANISDLELSTVQKLQLLKNTNNREISDIQIPEIIAGDTILSVIPQNSEARQVPNIATATFKVIVPYTSTSASVSLLNTVIDPAINADGFYLPLNAGEYFKINGVKYYTVGTTIKNYATNATVEIITNNGTQYRLFVGSVTGVALQANTLSASTFTVPSVRLIGDTEPIYTTTFPTSNSDAAIVYSSNNPSIATINATTGQITMVSPGSVTFTASQAATLIYASGSITSNQLTIYSTQVQISFNVAALDSTLQMDLSGSLPKTIYQLPASDATSVFYVKLSDMKEVFKFQTDSFDVNDASLSDVRYYVYKNKWPSTIKLNPAHSMVDVGDSTGMMGSSGMFAQNKALLKHDYVRYLAYKLFRTIHGVDLFKNESDLLENITYWGETIRNEIEHKLDLISTTSSDETMPIDGSGNRFLTNEVTTNTNIARELMMQIVGNSRSRLFGISGTTDIQTIPLFENDSFNILITVFAAENQNILTGSDTISSRTYNMKVVLKNDITGLNVPVIDSEMFPNAYPYSGNVAVITADSSANYVDYSPPVAVPVARYGFNGWYYKNTSAWVTVDPTVRNKIKWSVSPNTVSSKVSDLQYIRVNLKAYNKTSLPYITIYTASSKRAYLVSNSADMTNNGKYTFYVNFGAYDRLPAVIDHTNKELTVSGSGALTQGSFGNNETITRIALETDSAASYNAVEFTMSCIVVGETSGEKEHWFQGVIA